MDQEEASLEPKTPTASESPSKEEAITESEISLSPLCCQYNDKMRMDSLPFDCVLVSDEEIIESISQNLLRIIVKLHIQGNDDDDEIWCFDGGCKTPPSRHQNSTKLVPDTCPGAPMKLTKISRNIDSGLRRKLF